MSDRLKDLKAKLCHDPLDFLNIKSFFAPHHTVPYQ
jgi:hypothetical protein